MEVGLSSSLGREEKMNSLKSGKDGISRGSGRRGPGHPLHPAGNLSRIPVSATLGHSSLLPALSGTRGWHAQSLYELLSYPCPPKQTITNCSLELLSSVLTPIFKGGILILVLPAWKLRLREWNGLPKVSQGVIEPASQNQEPRGQVVWAAWRDSLAAGGHGGPEGDLSLGEPLLLPGPAAQLLISHRTP